MAEHLAHQCQLQRAIGRSLINLRKMGQDNWNETVLRTRIDHLKDQWKKFEACDAKLSALISPADQATMAYFKEGQFENTEEAYLGNLGAMTAILNEFTPSVSRNSTSRSEQASAASISSCLPTMKLPQFDGTLKSWEAFRDRFNALIIANASLSDVQRMHYLISSLTGRALECIGDIPITEDNFEIAWKTVTSRYENPRRLLSTHLASLLNLNALNRESATDLQDLFDGVNITISSLRKLGRTPADLWNDILVHIISQKLDTTTRKAWKLKTSDDVTPTSFDQLQSFIKSRIRALEEFASGSSNNSGPMRSTSTPRVQTSAARAHLATASKSAISACPLCQARHYLSACPSFLAKSPRQRTEVVKRLSRCSNCLSKNHQTSNCSSKYSCRVCQTRHHSLLHDESIPSVSSLAKHSSEIELPKEEIHSHLAATTASCSKAVLLATAWVQVSATSGRHMIVRALIDQGSEASFVTESLAQTLRAKRTRVVTSISAVGGVNAGTVRHAASLCLSPRSSSSPAVPISALVLGSLSTYHPQRIDNDRDLEHLSNLHWADPDPSSFEPIHIIIGADIYNDIILHGLRKGRRGYPIAQNTIFGWVISGPVSSSIPRSDSPVYTHHCLRDDPLPNDLRRFWEVEEPPTRSILSPEDESCELHFRANTSRNAEGRYIVRLPFRKGPPIDIGHSLPRAERMVQSLARKLQGNPVLAKEYNAFLRDYENLGHMQRVPTFPQLVGQCVYIPHHPVLREGSATTHLRVVFNASSITSNGSSLNDHLLSGPKLQSDLPAVILRWRRFRFVYTADIAKMYRQILVDPRDLDYQRILWKLHPSEESVAYQLLTVTYGMTCAPFLALRVLRRLVEDEGQHYPLAMPILQSNIYVDDVLFGGDNISDLRQSRDQLNGLLSRGHFKLRKWASNASTLLSDIDPSDHGLACTKLLAPDDHVQVLGISWNPSRDAFEFRVSLAGSLPSSKRSVLSTIAKLYDPLGWVTPAIISAKVLIQELWRLRVDWDDPLPEVSLRKWETIYTQLSSLNGLQLDRWTGQCSDCSLVEIHGFADASTIAYAAAVYAKCISSSGVVTITLLAGKSKVAPIKPMTVPRLELQAAVLLTRLMEFVLSSFEERYPCYCWTDSTVVLAWLQQHPSRWQTFVANRVNEIQTRLPAAKWHHVKTTDNPADCASRGLLGDNLRGATLWWKGPDWLLLNQSNWPLSPEAADADQLPEARVVTHHVVSPPPPWDLETRFSSWPKLIRVTAYLQRFIRRCRRRSTSILDESFSSLALNSAECNAAKFFWIKRIQLAIFPKEIHALCKQQPISAKHALLPLNPFVDEEGILRVGGRLKHALLPRATKHPILLAAHPVVHLIIEQAHVRSLHSGLQLTLSILRQDYWILRVRTLAKSVIHACITCIRERANVPMQLMGNLPNPRVTPPKKCFAHCGLDYAGPVSIRASAGRGITSRKAYICLFICLATKAVHLELVSDYSSQAFLSAYTRFCSRRGLPEAIYSDNGTTFIGADRELTIAYRSALRNPEFLNKTASDGVSWHFIPPSAPHFGGLWEAGVRSVKHHMRRVLGNHTLTFEEFTTLLCAIEACLNSRPIAPLSDTLDDYEPLTPGHFLIGSALTVFPQPSLLDLSENRLSRWQLLHHMTERLWKLWKNDYLNTLQQRAKWRRPQPAIAIGQLVLLRNPNLPPCKWELGRVSQVHPGDDGHIRVVTLKTATSTFKRPIVKVCPLPIVSASAT